MNNADIRNYIIRELGKHHNPDDVIKEVCERTGMGWSDAQKFVRQVYAENRTEIAGYRNGILIFLVVIEIIAGFVLSVGVVGATLSGWIIFLLRLPIPYLGNLVYFLLGVFLILGGLKGYSNIKPPKK